MIDTSLTTRYSKKQGRLQILAKSGSFKPPDADVFVDGCADESGVLGGQGKAGREVGVGIVDGP
jgi:hypothetical protein